MKQVLLPELRYRRSWMLLGLAIAAFITVVCLVPSRDLPDLRLSDKLEHILAYVALSFWFASVVVRRDYLGLALALVAFGGLIELLQGWMGLGRTADWLDLRADVIGIAIGMALALTPLGGWARWVEARMNRPVQ